MLRALQVSKHARRSAKASCSLVTTKSTDNAFAATVMHGTGEHQNAIAKVDHKNGGTKKETAKEEERAITTITNGSNVSTKMGNQCPPHRLTSNGPKCPRRQHTSKPNICVPSNKSSCAPEIRSALRVGPPGSRQLEGS